MTRTAELNDRVHAAQVAAVTRTQDLTVGVVRQLVDLREKAGRFVPGRVRSLVAPLNADLAARRKSWAEVALSFQSRLLEALDDSSQPVAGGSGPTAVATPSSARSRSKKA